jgi:hypothetical protein
MRLKAVLVSLVLFFFACNTEQDVKSGAKESSAKSEIPFDKTKWAAKEGLDYPFREQMLNNILHNDTIRTLNRDEITDLLGAPDRSNEGHLYYMVVQKRLGSWPLHTKTMVIKLLGDDTIEWIKIHE